MEYLNNVTSQDCIGKILKTKKYGNFKVIDYKSWQEVEVEFIETGYRKLCQMKEIKTGVIKDLFLPKIYGNGFVGDKYETHIKVGGKLINAKHYEHWRGMLRRCYNENERHKAPTYKGCKVSENFKSYTYFYEWCEKQIGFDKTGWALDKDILTKGNKVYSENTCFFVPFEINNVLAKNNKNRGIYPIGVHFCNNKKLFVAQINRNKCQQDYLGTFESADDAFIVYKKAKEEFIKEVANKWKGEIDDRAYQALLDYKVEITD